MQVLVAPAVGCPVGSRSPLAGYLSPRGFLRRLHPTPESARLLPLCPRVPTCF
ncbi:hypothetical protein ACRRTK_017536 [Alexandromys fortis]